MRGDEAPSLSAPLPSLGIDSLISIELRNWFQQTIEEESTVLDLLNSNNILHLGEQAATQLKEKFRARLLADDWRIARDFENGISAKDK